MSLGSIASAAMTEVVSLTVRGGRSKLDPELLMDELDGGDVDGDAWERDDEGDDILGRLYTLGGRDMLGRPYTLCRGDSGDTWVVTILLIASWGA